MIESVGISGCGHVSELPLIEKSILITGSARRLGRAFALACAKAGADVVIHHGHSEIEAIEVRDEIASIGRTASIVEADLASPEQVFDLIARSNERQPLYGLVNSAAIFGPAPFLKTTFEDWDRHIGINLTAPFLLSQAFARQAASGQAGRIVNILDWRALRPGTDHFAYTVSKAALAAMTRSLAAALAPDITVNGLALGAILPPSDQPPSPDILRNVPAGRWGSLAEAENALLYLLAGPAYITGEIIYVDGGRHLV